MLTLICYPKRFYRKSIDLLSENQLLIFALTEAKGFAVIKLVFFFNLSSGQFFADVSFVFMWYGTIVLLSVLDKYLIFNMSMKAENKSGGKLNVFPLTKLLKENIFLGIRCHKEDDDNNRRVFKKTKIVYRQLISPK